MNRFRKKSDAKRSQVPLTARTNSPPVREILPELPPASDFRTSLILPDLSRRFTLLRTSTGDPITLDDLRSRFAEQRAKGASNHISEEEEDMILETLGRMRGKALNGRNTPDNSPRQTEYSTGAGRYSVRSNDTEVTESSSVVGSIQSSPSGRSNRYSNNLFGSGRLRDYSYARNATTQSKTGSTRSALSFTPTESSASVKNVEDTRPVTPEQSGSDSLPSSPSENLHSSQETAHAGTPPSSDHSIKPVNPSALRRASLALEKVIKEIEEEGEDEIVMPRSTPTTRYNGAIEADRPLEVRQSISETSTVGEVEAVVAISSDTRPELDSHRVSPVPFRIAPGYIPGMPRPMTPRDNMEFDDRSHSTTPRATSPAYAASIETNSPTTSKISSLSRFGRNSPSSPSPRPTSPLTNAPFLSRSTNGRHTPESGSRSIDPATEFDSPLNSSILGRRRPASPLSGPAYQPLAVSSRPSTPSNITWTPPSQSQQPKGHGRNGSWMSDGTFSSSEMHYTDDVSKSTTRSLRSPALPESPMIEAVSTTNSHSANGSDFRPFSPITGINLGPPHIARSPTPTQNVTRSPTSPTFPSFDSPSRTGSRRNSRQNAPSSPTALATFPSLAFSPIANSSRSSLESTGSSYHSSDVDHLKERGLSLFNDLDPNQPAWHEFPPESSSTTPGASPDDDWDMEDIIARYAGLHRSDFMAIQEKLVSAAVAKNTPPDVRERVPSLRRRRPSTSQSNYSLNGRIERIASPPPQTQPPSSPPTASNTDQVAKVNALLNSVVDSIQSTSPPSTTATLVERTSSNQSDRDISPTTRRNRDLAQVLFGDEAESKESPASPPPESTPVVPSVAPLQPLESAPSPPQEVTSPKPVPTSPLLSPLQQYRNASTPRLPQSPEEVAELHRAVQIQAEAATRALRMPPPPSNHNESTAILSSNSISRKRINPGLIGSPTLVSSTASVDTIPLRPPSSGSGNYGGPSKISQRFRKFRGTLKAKPHAPAGGEITPYPMDVNEVSPTGQAAVYDPSRLNPPGKTTPSSATDFGRAKVTVPSPPASAGPGIKGFMARFRSKKALESHQQEPEKRPASHSPASSHLPTSPLSYRRPATADAAGSYSSMSQLAAVNPHQELSFVPEKEPAPGAESEAIDQLFKAAEALSVDRQALTALLRSASSSSKTTLTRNPSMARAPQPDIPEEQSSSPPQIVTSSRPSIDGSRPSEDNSVKKGSIRRHVDALRPPRESLDAPSSSIVRRTIILASDTRSSTFDLNTLLRKSSNRRKRASAQSFSNRSVHDRVPTPPPPRSNASRRFSQDPSPPVPHLPGSSSPGDYLAVPALSNGTEKPNSAAYDSLYDMYAGDRAQSSAGGEYDTAQLPRHETPVNPEAGTALEVIELANGETIWSIVNGLRDDDVESVYAHRASFASEYSSRENGDGVQVFFKEHNRTGSKGSASSFLSRKKSQAKHRPETKVFYSSPAQIGRLIEDLSQTMDSGSFNILPTKPAVGHSTTSSVSDANWTVEERLEHMLGSMAK
ncbi:hypothetical protein PC9H_000711 [Pleurotus ostreatus]|uniref:Uncharacterized protein n=1 Tax=Pleurotus ostreatus TaxID=5322 RepID=A0A8H7A490_PLEOS|nr:uncharacterized protein PC9H_000711 [Pleurotus ostreatus]KAF7440367.1 hypothetical protein PC9H_000711 [Pleurotus ostreatus]KAJ8700310.1 hypothetical protein PTI98_003351 [Pleurotus ostreatus]